MPPNEAWRSCCGRGWGFGADAYKERMDCLRSGRDVAAEVEREDEMPEGAPEEAGGAPPKKSSPSSESAGLGCAGVPEALSADGGGRAA